MTKLFLIATLKDGKGVLPIVFDIYYFACEGMVFYYKHDTVFGRRVSIFGETEAAFDDFLKSNKINGGMADVESIIELFYINGPLEDAMINQLEYDEVLKFENTRKQKDDALQAIDRLIETNSTLATVTLRFNDDDRDTVGMVIKRQEGGFDVDVDDDDSIFFYVSDWNVLRGFVCNPQDNNDDWVLKSIDSFR